MERNKSNPSYRDAKFEMFVFEPEFGGYALEEYRRKGNRLYLRGVTEAGEVIIQTWDIPSFDQELWKGETQHK